MFDSKLIITLVTMIVSILCFQSNIKENFINYPRTLKVDTVHKSKNGEVSLKNPILHQINSSGDSTLKAQNQLKPDLGWVSRPSLQSQISTRFDSGNKYGANIKTRPPAHENLGVPSEPFEPVNNSKCQGCGCATKENYCIGCNKTSCGMVPNEPYAGGAKMLEAGTATGNYNRVRDASIGGSHKVNTNSSIPVSSMRAAASPGAGEGDGDDSGNAEQPIVYDRLMYATSKSKLRQHGDHIRGDLPIVPCQQSWFRPSVNPSVDLHQGAMQILGGTGDVQKGMEELIYTTTAGYKNTIGGADLSTQLSSDFSSGLSDLSVTAFP